MAQIITRIKEDLHNNWQKELGNVVTDPKQLLEMLSISPEKYHQDFKARQLFPVRVPRPFINRMQIGNINDPLLKQVLSDRREFIETPGYVTDPLEEHDTVAEGLLHKYESRVLMIVKSGCAVNCRYCFRRHFPYEDNSPNKQRWQQALTYIKENQSLNEVIFSGGDPLMANDQHLGWLIKQVEDIPHIKRLRIHSRLPIVIPARVTDALVTALETSRLQTIMVLHTNHAQELDSSVKLAVSKMKQADITVLNQAVLLKGVNDTVADQVNLCEALFDFGVLPYYLHQFDPVQGASHFDVDIEEAREIAKGMMAKLPGFLMPKLVKEIAGEANKTPINLA